MKAADHRPLRAAQTAQKFDVHLRVDEEVPLRVVCDVGGFMDRGQPPAIIMRCAFEEAATFAREFGAGGGDDGG